MKIEKICVFCGSSPGRNPSYQKHARAFGRAMAAGGIDLVYGGGGIGLMGAVAGAVIESGRNVFGIIPYALATKERAIETSLESLVELRIVRTMHERKSLMVDMADAFVALPGGFGTFDEFFEALTWAQLGIHRKPIGLLNIDGYFDPLLAMIDRAIEEGFVRPKYRGLIIDSSDIESLFARLRSYEPPESIVKWVEMDET